MFWRFQHKLLTYQQITLLIKNKNEQQNLEFYLSSRRELMLFLVEYCIVPVILIWKLSRGTIIQVTSLSYLFPEFCLLYIVHRLHAQTIIASFPCGCIVHSILSAVTTNLFMFCSNRWYASTGSPCLLTQTHHEYFFAGILKISDQKIYIVENHRYHL